MTDEQRLELARKLARVSLDLPRGHEAHPAIDKAVEALLASQPQPSNHSRKTA